MKKNKEAAVVSQVVEPPKAEFYVSYHFVNATGQQGYGSYFLTFADNKINPNDARDFIRNEVFNGNAIVTILFWSLLG